MANKYDALQIREANKNDVQSIATLLFGLKTQYGSCIEKDVDTFVLNYQDSIKKAIASESNFIWIAELNGQMIGFMSYTARLVLRLGSRIATMEELFILKPHRRNGIAFALFNESTKMLRNIGIKNLEVVSSMAHSGQREWGKKIELEWYSNIHRRKL
jgi:N-acetylglutamate synthase-like GNAT family acetyltransferase